MPIPAKASTAGESSAILIDRIDSVYKPQRLPPTLPSAPPDAVPGSARVRRRRRAPFTLKLHETTQLHREIGTALEGTRKVGQINPRNPGLINDAIQLFKKAMRRSLTWYTRPLHEYQGGVVRALGQIAAILDNHNVSLRDVEKELRRRADTSEAESAANARTSAQDKAIFEQRTAALESRIGSLQESTASLEHAGRSLEHRLDEAWKSVEGKLDTKSLAQEKRMAAAIAEQEAKLEALCAELALAQCSSGGQCTGPVTRSRCSTNPVFSAKRCTAEGG